jgi:hypothetical protein
MRSTPTETEKCEAVRVNIWLSCKEGQCIPDILNLFKWHDLTSCLILRPLTLSKSSVIECQCGETGISQHGEDDRGTVMFLKPYRTLGQDDPGTGLTSLRHGQKAGKP